MNASRLLPLTSPPNTVTPPGEPTGLAAARLPAQVSVLFAEPLPSTPVEFAGWLEALGLAELGFTVSAGQAAVQLTSGQHTVRVQAGNGPRPLAGLDLRHAPELPREAFFLSLSHGTSPGGSEERFARGGAYPDPWASDGRMRVLSLLVARLAHEGIAVVLHQAGSLVKDSGTFTRLLRSLPHPDFRPFGAWVDFARRPGSRELRLQGMESFGLPDLLLAPEEWDTWETVRAREALFFAAYRMVRENRLLSVGEILEVPLDVQPGSWPEPFGGDTLRYRVRDVEPSRLGLERISDAGEPFRRWARASAPDQSSASGVGLNTYQALFRHGLEGALPGDSLAEMAPPASQGLPPHVVLVRTRLGQGGFTLVTNGFGRLPRPGGARGSSSAHMELAAWMDGYSPQRALTLSALGTLMRQGAGAEAPPDWEHGDIAVLSEPLQGLRHFVLAPGPSVPLPPGSPVSLLWAIPLHANEFERVRRAGPLDWANQLMKDPSRRTELWQRWNLGVH